MRSSILLFAAMVTAITNIPNSKLQKTEIGEVVESVLSSVPATSCPFFVLTQEEGNYTLEHLSDATVYSVGEYEVKLGNDRDSNLTLSEVSLAIGYARRLRQISQCMTVIVASDDTTLLTAFVEESPEVGLFLWSTRLLVVTRLPYTTLRGLGNLLSTTNSVLLGIIGSSADFRVSAFVQLPYSSEGVLPLRVATWTQSGGLSLTSQLSLFPEKYSKFMVAPHLTVAIEFLPKHKIYWVEDSTAPGGQRLVFEGAVNDIVEYLAQAINFTYHYVRPQVGTFGTELANGSWDGMVGMVMKKEVEFAPGPFVLTWARAQVIQYAWVFDSFNMKIVAAVGRPEVDPWSFFMPLTTQVWSGVVASLIALPTLLVILIRFRKSSELSLLRWLQSCFTYARVLLQQNIMVQRDWMWSERVVVGVWMLTTLVLTRSYAGNLMSLLAVRHVPQPFQSLRDVLDHPSVSMIWQKNSANEQYIKTVKSGMFREIALLEDVDRLKYQYYSQFSSSLNTLVEKGDHVLIDNNLDLANLIVQDFSRRGQCNFYLSREGYLPLTSALITHKDNPILVGINKRVMGLWDSGLYNYWYIQSIPNSTSCRHLPNRIIINATLSMLNLWGMFVVLAGGVLVAGVVLVGEIITARLV